jgi:phage minor structural protein
MSVDISTLPQVYSASGKRLAVLNKSYDVIINDQIITDTNGFSTLTLNIPYDDPKLDLFDVEDEIHLADNIFIIRTIQKGWDGQGSLVAQVYAEAKWYDLAGYDPVQPFSQTGGPLTVLEKLLEGTDWTIGVVDVSGSQEFALTEVTNPLAAIMTLPTVYGGELWFDCINKKVHFRQEIGDDNGVLYAYRKNLESNKKIIDTRTLYTRLRPYGASDEDNNPLTIKSVNDNVDYLENYSWFDQTGKPRKIKCYEITNEDIDDPDELKSWGESILNELAMPKITYEMAVVIDKQRGIPGIGDTIHIYDPKLKMSLATRVAQRSYNVREPWKSTIQASTALYMTSDQQIVVQNHFTQQKSFFQNAIDSATDAITGVSGGYVVLNPSKHPREILIMDTPDIKTAQKVWRWNSGGLGYSKDGYDGPYGLAMTMNGEIVADFITAGVLRAIDIEGVHIKGANIEGAYFHAPGDFDMSGDSSMRNYISEWEGTAEGGEDKWLGFASKGGFVFAYLTGQTTTTPIPYEEIMAIMRGKINVYADLRMNGAIITLDSNGWSGGTKNQIYENADDEYLTLDSTKGIQLIERTGDDSEVMLCASRDLHDRMTLDTYGDIDMHGWYLKNANIQDESLEELKQDIVPYEENALDILNKIKIYRFRFKKDVSENINHKKYGPIIGKKRKKLPEEILSYDGKGIDAYNERHLMMKAIQELSDKVGRLEKRVAELEGAANA